MDKEQVGELMLAVLQQQKSKKIAGVERHKGAGISIPEGVTIPDAITSLQQQMEYEEKLVQIVEDLPCLPYDGACIMMDVLEEEFGNAAMGVAKSGGFFMPDEPPKLVTVKTGPNAADIRNVAWGDTKLIGIDGVVSTSFVFTEEGTVNFRIVAKIKRKDEARVRAIIAKVRERIPTHSIYRGKAIRVRFRDASGDYQPVPLITFIETSSIQDSDLVYSAPVRRQIETSVFTPIEAAKTLRKMGVPAKRGVLLYGPYGTGKTLTAYGAAKRAVAAGMTFLYLEKAEELPDAMKFAKNYGPCVIFAEDIDRHVSGEERTVEIDQILNCLDGVDTKGAELLVVFTTNNVEAINSAMMRPGRLDAVIHVTPPDAVAAGVLVENYSRGMLANDIDMTVVGEAMKGLIPAVIREAVERAKLFSVNEMVRSGAEVDGKSVRITTSALVDATNEVRKQTALATRKTRPLTPGEQLASGISRIFEDDAGLYPRAESKTVDADDDFVNAVLNQ
jgi:transitional endoplasmic reticulum ATPase